MSQGALLEQYHLTAQRAAAEVIRAYSTSFGAATRLLGARHREHIRNIYALVRVADELVDGVAASAGLSIEEQRETLLRFVAETNRAVNTGYSSDLIVDAFAQTARYANFGAELTQPFFDSMEHDLLVADEVAPDHTRAVLGYGPEEHATYVYGSAEVIGLMCLRVFMRDEQRSVAELARLDEGARHLGAAFQNINFLRDLADDTTRLQRSYLSADARLSESDKERWVTQIRSELANAEDSLSLLPKDARGAVRSALGLFRELTDRVENTPVLELYQRRVRVPNLKKAGLISEALVTTWRERS